MGIGESAPESLYNTDTCLFNSENRSAFEVSIDERAFGLEFTSVLFHKTKSQIVQPYEYPCNHLIADIIISPQEYTQHESSIDAIEKVILPLLKGSDESKPIIHQALIQYFAFLKDRNDAFIKKEKKNIEIQKKQQIEEREKVVDFHKLPKSNSPADFRSFADLIKIIPPHLDPNLAFQPACEVQCQEISKQIKDLKSAVISIIYGFFSGNISLLINSFIFCYKMKKTKIDFKYPSVFDSLALIPLDCVAFVPNLKTEPLYSKIAEYAIRNETLCSNGRFVYIAEDVGFISIYLNGNKNSQHKISKKNIHITCSNGILYATDYEKEYLFKMFPFSKIAENTYNTGKQFNSKHKISFPCSTDGCYIYCLGKSKKINVFTITNNEITLKRTIELTTGERPLRDPYKSELIPKGSSIYTNGIIITFIIITTCSNQSTAYSYFARHFSALSGEHLGDRTFSMNFPITSICFDNPNQCFFGISPSKTAVTIVRFPYRGPVTPTITGLTYKNVPDLEVTASKFNKMKYSDDAFNNLYDFFTIVSAHLCGLSFNECLYNSSYDPKFVQFFAPGTKYLFDVLYDTIQLFIAENKYQFALPFLSLLQINFQNGEGNFNRDAYLTLFESILNNPDMKILHRIVCFILTTSFKLLLYDIPNRIPPFFEMLLKQGPLFSMYFIKRVRESELLPFCFTEENTKSIFTSIFDRTMQNKEVGLVDLDIIENFHESLIKMFTLAFLKNKGRISKDISDLQKLFLLYSKLLLPKYGKHVSNSSEILEDDFSRFFRKYLFLLLPNLKYSMVSHSLIGDFYSLLINIYKHVEKKQMIDNEHFTFNYLIFLETLFTFVQCTAAILKGGKEVQNCSDFLWMRQPLVDAKMSADIFETVSCVIFNQVTTKNVEITGITEPNLLDFLNKSLADTNSDALDGLYKKYSNILCKHLTKKEKQLERIIFLLFMKYYEFEENIIKFIKTGEPNKQTEIIMKCVYKVRSKLREISQQIKEDPSKKDAFIEDLLQKSIFLLFMNFKSIEKTEIMKNLNAFLFSKHDMHEIFDMISAADRSRAAIQEGIEYTEKLINSELNTDLTTFVFDFLFIHRVVDRYVRYIDSKTVPRTISLMTKEFLSNAYLIFYFKYLTSLVKSNSSLLKDQIIKILNVIHDQNLPSSFTILIIFLVEYSNNKELIIGDDIAGIVFQSKDNVLDIPLLRIAFHAGIKIPIDIYGLMEHIKTDSNITHSAFLLMYEMLVKLDEKEQEKVYIQILTNIAYICIGKIYRFSSKSFDESYSICEEYLIICRKSLNKPIFAQMIEYIIASGERTNKEEKYKMFHKQKYIAAAFAILSNPFEFKHIHALVKSAASNLNYYVSDFHADKNKYVLWSLPITAKKDASLVNDSKDLVPISQQPFTTDLYPCYSRAIPFIVKTLNATKPSVRLYYIFQSFKVFLSDQRFLQEFVSSQKNFRLNSFLFWNIAQTYFKTIISCPVVKTSNYDFTLCSDEEPNVKIGQNSVEATGEIHFLFSNAILEESKLRINIERGTAHFGIHCMSLFPYNLQVCGCEGKTVYFNDFAVKQFSEKIPTAISFDPHSLMITFLNDSEVLHEMEVPSASYCFFIVIKGKTKLTYKIIHDKNGFESDDEIYEDAKEFLSYENKVAIIEYPKEVLEAIGSSLNTSLISDKLPTFHSCDVRKLSSLSPFGIFNPKICNSITSETRNFLLKELFLAMKTELMTQTFLNSLNNVEKALSLFQVTPQRLVEIMTSLLHLIEPLNFETSIVDFSFNVFTTKPATFEFKCIEQIISYFKPKELIKLWLEILKTQFSQPDFHFAKVASVSTLVYNLQSFGESRTVEVQSAHAFLVFRIAFGSNSSVIATVGKEFLTSNNIIYIPGDSFQIQKSENATDETIIVIPLFDNPNLSLFDSFVEFAISLKYFIIYLSENSSELDSSSLKHTKHAIYQMFIDAFDSESPFFFTHSNSILQFMKTHIPLSSNDLDSDMAKPLSLFALYSKRNPFVIHFLNEIQVIWDEKTLLPLKSFFPPFLTKEDSLALKDLGEIKWELPSPKFPEFIDGTSDTPSIMNAVLNLLKPRDVIEGFPFQFLLHFWAKFTSQFPPFEKKVIGENKLAIKFIYYKPVDYEFVFKALKPPKYKILSDEKVEGYDVVIESDAPVAKSKFVIRAKHAVDSSRFIYDHRERFSSDIMALFVKWDLHDDEILLKFFDPSDLKAPSLPLTINVQKIISYNLSMFPSVLSIRYLLLKILNWLFFSQKIDIPNESKILYDSLSFTMRLGLFKQIIEQRSNSTSVELTISRKLAFEIRNNLSTNIDHTIVAQIAKQYKDPKVFRRQGEKPWVVVFENERGVDGGGPARELVTEAAKDMMTPQCGIFSDTEAHFFVPIGKVTDKKIYRVVGVILGIIVRNSLVQDFRFPMFFWGYLCGNREITIDDIYSFDSAYKLRMENLKNTTEENFDHNMGFVETDFKGNQIQLKPGKVTFETRNEFILLSNRCRISEVMINLKEIRDGFYENIDVKPPYYVTPRLLEFAVCGVQKISFEALTKQIKFEGVKFAQKKIFLDVIKSFNLEERSMLLKFVTGRVRLPMVTTSDTLFTVDYLFGENNGLPKASSCFLQFHLPEYSSFDTARKMIKIAIEFSGTFENK